jgi:hypothetical protein
VWGFLYQKEMADGQKKMSVGISSTVKRITALGFGTFLI